MAAVLRCPWGVVLSGVLGVSLDEAALGRVGVGERARLERLLGLVRRGVEENPLWGFRPHAAQARFLGAGRVPVKMFAGGNRAGKTVGGVVDDIVQAVDRGCLPDWLVGFKCWEPPFRCRIVSPDFTSTMEGVVFETIRRWVPRGQLVGGEWARAYDKQRRRLSFANGSWFEFLTAEQDVDKHSGASLDRVHFDEEPPGEKGRLIFQENKMRVLDREGQISFTMTPLLGLTWSFDEVWERRFEDGFFCLQVDMDENPHLSEAAKARALDGYSADEIRARKEGRFVHFKGLVYPVGPRTVGGVDEECLRGQSVGVAIDPGLRRSAVVFGAFDGDNALLVFDELYVEGATPDALARLILDKCAGWGVSPDFYVIDPSARNRTLVNAENVQGALARAGVVAMAGQNALEPGVMQVRRRIEDGSLVVSERCGKLLWEMGRYRVQPKPDGSFGVVKENDHACDALRYLCMARRWGAVPKRDGKRRSAWVVDPYREVAFP